MKTNIEQQRGGANPVIVFTHEVDSEEIVYRLPARYVVCGHCSGTGTSSAHLGAWTADEWSQESYEFREDYLNGLYDKECPECHGLRVVAVPYDWKDYSPKQQEVFKLYLELQDEDAQYEAMCAAERRMGA